MTNNNSNYWSKLDLFECWSDKERFNFVMTRIDDAIVGDSDLNESIQEVISDYNNLVIPTKISDLVNDSGFITEHQSLEDYIVKSDVQGLIRNDGSIDSGDYVTFDDIEDVIHTNDTNGLLRNDGSVDINEYLTSHQDISGKADIEDLSDVAFSGDYIDLINTPSIPEKISDLVNDSDFITEHQSLSDYISKSNTSGLIRNDGSVDTNIYLTEHQDISSKVDSSDLDDIAFSGSYTDLSDTPSIPSKLSDLNDDIGYLTEHQSLDEYIIKSNISGLIRNDGTIDVNQYLTEHQDITGKANTNDLNEIAFTGDYNDLINNPFIPSKTSDLTDDIGFLTSHQDISGKIDRNELFRNGVFETKNTNNRGSISMIWNESDGGGTLFEDNTSGVKSFVGVNEGSQDKDIYVQIYSKNKTTNNGVRLNFNPTGAYCTVGSSTSYSEEDRILTKKDLNSLINRIELLENNTGASEGTSNGDGPEL